MPKLLQINVSANWGAHGRIAEQIGLLAQQRGWEVYMAYGRQNGGSALKTIRIGGKVSVAWHGVESLLLDNQGLASRIDTKRFVRQIKEIQPDIIHLHNIHGYYLNYKILIEFLKEYGKPVVWTLHDCWSFTGHCTHFEYNGCFKWKEQCHDCVNRKAYPKSLFLDHSRKNYNLKKKLFPSLSNLTLVSVSKWLNNNVNSSFLNRTRTMVIYNGVDVDTFAPQKRIEHSGFKILGVASNWKMNKGLSDFIQLRKLLPDNYHITLVGLTQKEIKKLPHGITGICRTDRVEELVYLYSNADIFVNPSYEETFGMTTIEALSCGTPSIVYDTTACPELINEQVGKIVPLYDVKRLAVAVEEICKHPQYLQMRKDCREYVTEHFDCRNKYQEYIDLYNKLISQ